jgi:hypothetical protein
MRGKRHTLYIVNFLLRPIEKFLARKIEKQNSEYKPIFIIGSPRSGSTLLSQVFFNAGDYSYITNLGKDLYSAPILCDKLLKAFTKTSSDMESYKSAYGKMKGISSPHEGGNFWYQWFPRSGEQYVERNGLQPKMEEKVKHEINKIQNYSKKPFLSKNLYLSLWIAPLKKIFPKAIFIVCRRDSFAISCSLYYSRKKILKNTEKWFSVPPPNSNKIRKLSGVEQVIIQPKLIYEQIYKDIKRLNSRDFLIVDYEELCKSPRSMLGNINKFLEYHDHMELSTESLPNSFDLSHEIGKNLTVEELCALKDESCKH